MSSSAGATIKDKSTFYFEKPKPTDSEMQKYILYIYQLIQKDDVMKCLDISRQSRTIKTSFRGQQGVICSWAAGGAGEPGGLLAAADRHKHPRAT